MVSASVHQLLVGRGADPLSLYLFYIYILKSVQAKPALEKRFGVVYGLLPTPGYFSWIRIGFDTITNSLHIHTSLFLSVLKQTTGYALNHKTVTHFMIKQNRTLLFNQK